MRRSRIVASVVAAVGVIAAAGMTLAPVAYTGTVEQPVNVTATQTLPAKDLCASVTLEATMSAQLWRPMIDLWTSRQVRDVTLSDLKVTAGPQDDCDGVTITDPRLTGLQTSIVIANPQCDNPFEASQEEWDSDDGGMFGRCSDRAVAITSYQDSGPHHSSAFSGHVRGLGGSSPVIRGDRWCLDVHTGVVFTVGGNASDSGGDVTYEGDACFDLR